MSIRKLLPLMMFALALLAGSAAFAADAPPVPMSQEEFLASLQAPADKEGTALPEVDGVPAPQMRHGSCSWIGVTCKACATGGEQACDRYRCNYNGSIHYHTVCSGSCSPICNV